MNSTGDAPAFDRDLSKSGFCGHGIVAVSRYPESHIISATSLSDAQAREEAVAFAPAFALAA